MSLAGKVEVDVELKASGDHKIQAVDLHEGDWETPGSIKLWKYIIDGKTEIFKERVHFDDKDKCITMDGKYKVIFQVLNKDEGGLVKLSLEYEKHKATDEPPYQYLDFVAGLIKDIDAHLVKAA
ncbi:hypothetical protein ACOSP7_019536 [Xanthoceras sorbifolium]